jgi:hypothetical protein
MSTMLKISAIAAISAIGFASCNNGGGDAKKENTDSAKAAPRAAVAIAKVGTSPDFAGAALSMKAPTAEKVGKDSVKLSFAFDVKNYELKAQTPDGSGKGCANSAQGQHIHFILDNTPYKALYEPKNEVTMANNTEHYLLCFLSRSYHESLKNKEAAVLLHFKIDEKGNYKKLDDPKTPMVFYSRPKGDYIGKDTASVLLDFYVWNTALSAEGNKVKAQIMNEDLKIDTTVTINAWESNFIQNLGTGKCKVMLTLVDKDGKALEGPMTSATREFKMAASEPMK